jgi:glycosyltransferase involved in cell wall biosynthesis
LEETDIAQLLTAADIFAWPAINEAFGMAILEAHRHGLPVVAGYTDGVAATVADTRTGFLTPAGDPVSFANALSALIQDVSIRAQMAKNARDIFLERHTIELAAETIQLFLSQIKTQ